MDAHSTCTQEPNNNSPCIPVSNGAWGCCDNSSQTLQYVTISWEDLRAPEEGNGNPLQYSCLENPRDGGACWAPVYGVAQSWTWLKRLSSSSSSCPCGSPFWLKQNTGEGAKHQIGFRYVDDASVQRSLRTTGEALNKASGIRLSRKIKCRQEVG